MRWWIEERIGESEEIKRVVYKRWVFKDPHVEGGVDATLVNKVDESCDDSVFFFLED